MKVRSFPVLLLIPALLLTVTACGRGDTIPVTPEDRQRIVADPGTGLLPPLDWPEPGAAAPRFTLPALAGGEINVPDDFVGRAVLMQFFSMG